MLFGCLVVWLVVLVVLFVLVVLVCSLYWLCWLVGCIGCVGCVGCLVVLCCRFAMLFQQNRPPVQSDAASYQSSLQLNKLLLKLQYISGKIVFLKITFSLSL